MLCTKPRVECLMGTVRHGTMGVVMLLGWDVRDQEDPPKVQLMIFQCILGFLIRIGNYCTVLAFPTKLKPKPVKTSFHAVFPLCIWEHSSVIGEDCECWIFTWKSLPLSSSLFGISERISSVIFIDCVKSWGQLIHKGSFPDLASDQN